MTRIASTAILFLILFFAAGSAFAQPLQPGGSARVSHVVDGDTVILDRPIEGSKQVRLVGIQAPKLPLGRKNFKVWPLADEAKTALEKLILGKHVTVQFGTTHMDRHGRLLAHLYTKEGDWVQGALLRAGMARVYGFPDNRALLGDMLVLEGKARQVRRGIWDNGFYAVRSFDKVERLIGTFQLVEGVVVDAQTVRNMTYLNFTTDWRTDFTASIDKRALKSFKASGLDPLTLKGRTVRVRGWIKKRNGPMIDLSHPEQIEIVDQ